MATSYLNVELCSLRLDADEEALTGIKFISSTTQNRSEPEHPVLQDAERQLEEYFSGKRTIFDLKLKFPLNANSFFKNVWKHLREVPFATTISYGELSRRATGSTTSARAVGLANNRNPFPVVIPCHRVIGADGNLTGFGGGLTLKRRLLALEGIFTSADFRLSMPGLGN